MIRKSLAVLVIALWPSASFAASCFWVGGTGNSNDATHWSSSSGGTGSTCAAAGGVPATSSDTATFDASSGGGTVTINNTSPWTLNTISVGAFTGTWDNSVNNVNMTLTTTNGTAFNGNGTGVRTYKLGTATYTMTGVSPNWSISTINNLTFQGSSATIVYSNAALSQPIFNVNGQTFGTLSLGSTASTGYYNMQGAFTVGTFNVTAPIRINSPSSTITVTNPLNWTGTSTAQIFVNSGFGSTSTFALATGSTIKWAGIYGSTFSSGSPVISNSFDLGANSGATFTAPSGGGGCIINGRLDLPHHINDNFPAWIEKAG